MNKESILKKIDKLQKEFDYLYSTHQNPIRMRYIGCEIIRLKNLLK